MVQKLNQKLNLPLGQALRSLVPAIDPALAAKIVDIEDRDGPRAAYVVLSTRLKSFAAEGQSVPAELVSLQTRLAAECVALSQGR